MLSSCLLSLQIGKPDEYDCMFTCLLRSSCVYYPSSPSKSYAGLQTLTKSNWEPSELLSPSDDKDFICPKAFKAYFREHVKRALRRCHLAGKDKEIGMLKVIVVLCSCWVARWLAGRASD